MHGLVGNRIAELAAAGSRTGAMAASGAGSSMRSGCWSSECRA
jgi:hypothetical protein